MESLHGGREAAWEIHLRCSRFLANEYVPVFVSDLQPARLLWYRRWTRENFPIKSQVGIKAVNAQPTPGTQQETGNQVRSCLKPVFSSASWSLIPMNRSNTPNTH